MKFTDGEIVYYRHEKKGLLGPFTVGLDDDGSIGLRTIHTPETRLADDIELQLAELRKKHNLPPPVGNHSVHAITEDGQVLTYGDFSPIDVTHLVRPVPS